jgi:Tfp pilus assembly protein PilF
MRKGIGQLHIGSLVKKRSLVKKQGDNTGSGVWGFGMLGTGMLSKRVLSYSLLPYRLLMSFCLVLSGITLTVQAQPTGALPPITFTVSRTGQVITLPRATTGRAVALPSGQSLNAAQKQDLRTALKAYQQGQFALTETMLLKLTAEVPTNGTLQALLGEYYISQKSYPKALTAYQKAMRLAPRQAIEEQLARLYYHQASANNAKNTNQLALLDVLQQQLPNAPLAHFLAGVGFMQAKVPEKALPAFEQALRLNPNYTDAHYNLGCLFDGLGRPAQAKAHFAKALQLQPEATDILQAYRRTTQRLADKIEASSTTSNAANMGKMSVDQMTTDVPTSRQSQVVPVLTPRTPDPNAIPIALPMLIVPKQLDLP